jgi:hypothetical protein
VQFSDDVEELRVMDVLEWKHNGKASDRCRWRGRKIKDTWQGLKYVRNFRKRAWGRKYYLTDLGQDEKFSMHKKLLVCTHVYVCRHVCMYIHVTH